MTREARIYVGTRKGAFIFRSTDDRKTWAMDPPVIPGWSVYHLLEDPRDPDRVYAAANHDVWGPWLARSLDGGRTWGEHTDSPKFAPDNGVSVKNLWAVRPGHAARPGEVWAGVDPGSLFRSADWGATWQPVPALNEHPTRDGWMEGGGGLCLHNILLNESNPDSLIVTISAGGAFRSDDGGASFRPVNQGVRADFLPDPSVPAGHCVHRMVRSAADPDWLFQQNHCGAYRSTDGGETWQEVTAGLPSEFGFAAAAHPHEPRTIVAAPLKADSFRVFPDGAMTLWRTRDGGDTWQPLTHGLPQRNAYLSMFRGALATDSADAAGVYAGTSTGQLYASRDSGDTWRPVSEHLPPILSVEAVTA